MTEQLSIRTARPKDAERLVAVYAPYVLNTAITFEYEVPTVAEFGTRMAQTLHQYPYIVAEEDQRILGYAYAGTFIGRPAYDWSVETLISVEQGNRGRGIGGKLHQALENILREMHILNLNACIAHPEIEDEYLTRSSVAFHRHLGYRWVGEFHRCGYKFGRWYNMVWMEKILSAHQSLPKAVQRFDAVRETIGMRYGIV